MVLALAVISISLTRVFRRQRHGLRSMWLMASVLGLAATAGCSPTHKVLIPRGYVGWVRVDFGVPGEPPLPHEGNVYVMRIPSRGRLKTSTPLMKGIPKIATEYYPRGSQPGRATGGGLTVITGNVDALTLFIGTERQWRRLVQVAGDGVDVRIGPLNPRWADAEGRRVPALAAGDRAPGTAGTGAYQWPVKLPRAMLSGADLSGAALQWARLRHAKLRRVNLDGADLFRADLANANLTGASLKGAKLEGADFQRAKLKDADLQGAAYDDATLWPTGYRPSTHGAIRVPNHPGHSRARYQIPRGYVGSVRVDYGVKSAPALPVDRDGYFVITVSADGRAKTASPNDFAQRSRHEFYYYDKQGRRKLDLERHIHEKSWASAADSGHWGREEFFIGTTEELRKRGFLPRRAHP